MDAWGQGSLSTAMLGNPRDKPVELPEGFLS